MLDPKMCNVVKPNLRFMRLSVTREEDDEIQGLNKFYSKQTQIVSLNIKAPSFNKLKIIFAI